MPFQLLISLTSQKEEALAMGFIDVDVEDTPELELVPEGERTLRCIEADQRESNSGNEMIVLTLEDPQNELTEEVREYLVLPGPEDDQRTSIRKKQAIKDACQAFGVDPAGGFETSGFIGKQADAIVAHDSDPEYGEQARVQRFVTPA